MTRLLVVLACTLPVSALLAISPDSESRFESGKEIFQHEWVYEPPNFPDAKDLEPDEFMRQIAALPSDGLGPMHNATSCESCHERGGGAGVDRNVTLLTLDPRNAFLNDPKLDIEQTRQLLEGLYPGLLSPAGTLSMDVVVHEKSARPFYDSIRESIAKFVPDGAPESWFHSDRRTIDAVAQAPVLAGRKGDIDFYLSQRNSPPLHGLGQINQIQTSRLQMIAKAQSRRTHGKVSGRLGVGRFGWRGQTATLSQFVSGACAGELGLQVSGTPQPADVADATYVSLGIDLDDSEVFMLSNYVALLPPPTQQIDDRLSPSQVRSGKRLFASVGCSDCHVEHIYPARGIFSDLLLHDMGALLQAPSPAPIPTRLARSARLPLPRFPSTDPALPSLRRGAGFGFIGSYYGTPGSATPRPYPMARPLRPKFPRGFVPDEVYTTKNPELITWDALQREWRTPPLWGVADSAPYLHDGRAPTVDAAIRWHGGEALDSVTKYRTLESSQRQLILQFLSTLRAPTAQDHDEDESESYELVGKTDPSRLQELAATVGVFD